jgi:hypothetical protein
MSFPHNFLFRKPYKHGRTGKSRVLSSPVRRAASVQVKPFSPSCFSFESKRFRDGRAKSKDFGRGVLGGAASDVSASHLTTPPGASFPASQGNTPMIGWIRMIEI